MGFVVADGQKIICVGWFFFFFFFFFPLAEFAHADVPESPAVSVRTSSFQALNCVSLDLCSRLKMKSQIVESV